MVTDVGFKHEPLARRNAIRFDAPIDVSQSSLMSIPRRNVRALIAPDSASVDVKGRADGIMTLRRA